MLCSISHTSTFHKFHWHFTHFWYISQTAKTFHTFHMQIWNDTPFISLFDNPSMFAVSGVFSLFLIMFRSFWRWNALPVHLLRLVYKLVFLRLFGVFLFHVVFSSIFEWFLLNFWCIFAQFWGSKPKRKWGQVCIKFQHVFECVFCCFFMSLKRADLDKTSVFTLFFHVFHIVDYS